VIYESGSASNPCTCASREGFSGDSCRF
jgi:hypothetical protein